MFNLLFYYIIIACCSCLIVVFEFVVLCVILFNCFCTCLIAFCLHSFACSGARVKLFMVWLTCCLHMCACVCTCQIVNGSCSFVVLHVFGLCLYLFICCWQLTNCAFACVCLCL